MAIMGKYGAIVVALVGYFLADAFWEADVAQLKGHKVLLCGASKGIGRDLARQYAEAGADLVVVARTEPELVSLKTELEAKYKTRVHVVTADLSSEAGVDEMIRSVYEDVGWKSLDVLVLNHLMVCYGKFLQKFKGMHADMSYLTKSVHVNQLSYFQIATKTILMLNQSTSPTGASIIAVSSLAGKIGMPLTTGYTASKHALHGFFSALRHDLIMEGIPPTKIAVTLSVLGNIDTEANREVTKGLLPEWLEKHPVDEAASSILQGGLQRRRESYYPYRECVPMLYLQFFFPAFTDSLARHVAVKWD
eukprot:m.85760 g.85760  ORF g.85760 m.85760 type:complete len:306 (-) comp25897_c0_seq1:269-1186(-)